MKDKGFIIFTVFNDATRLYLQDLFLSECFDEDDCIAFVSFEETKCGAISQTADIVLIYDKMLDFECTEQLGAWVNHVRQVFCVFHRGQDSPQDHARIAAQKGKISQICGEKLSPASLSEHSTCGQVYDVLVALGDAVKRSDRTGYEIQLKYLASLFYGFAGLDDKLDLLHSCLTPQQTMLTLQRMEKNTTGQIPVLKLNHSLYELIKSLKNTGCFDVSRIKILSLLRRSLLENE